MTTATVDDDPEPVTLLAPLGQDCPMCEALNGPVEFHRLRYIPHAADPFQRRPDLPYEEPREHLRVTCWRCRYSWPAATACYPRSAV